MLVYPQLSQFPITKKRQLRTVVNRTADGSTIKLADPPAGFTTWRLDYANLADAEIATIEAFFSAVEGTLNGFTFLDPAANLLAWSDRLGEAVWEKDPMLNTSGGPAEWVLSNTGTGTQGIYQTLSVPGEFIYCFSSYVRSTQPAEATMVLGSIRATKAVGTGWSRITLSAHGDRGADSIRFGLELGAEAVVEVYGLQVEPQGAASTYKSTRLGGVYEGARLADDTLAMTATGVNRHSCTVNIIHANHL